MVTSDDEINYDIVSLVFPQEIISGSELLFPDPFVMPNNNNVSHFIPNNSDTQNISINSLASSEGEETSPPGNLESDIREDDPDVILNRIKAKYVDRLIIAHINFQNL